MLLDNFTEDAITKMITGENPKVTQRVPLKKLVNTINSWGIFLIWEKRNADAQGSGTYDLTSLIRNVISYCAIVPLAWEVEGRDSKQCCSEQPELWKVLRNANSVIYFKNSFQPIIFTISAQTTGVPQGFVTYWSLSSATKYNGRVRVHVESQSHFKLAHE